MATADELGIDSVQDVLENVLGLEGSPRGDEYNIPCPNPSHFDSNPSCDVNLTTGLWHCFSCGVGGDLVRLGSLVMGKPTGDIEELLKPSSAEALLTSLQRRLSRIRLRPSRKVPPPLPGPYEPGPLTELYARGFTKQILRKWGVRFVPEETLEGKERPFTIRSCYAIPIRDSKGHLLAWCYRRTASSPAWQPRYIYTPGVDISELWFGLQFGEELRRAETVVVTEGALDAIAVNRTGHAALGLLGSQMGNRKLLELQRYQSVTVVGDLNAAGVQAVERIGELLGHRMPLYVARYAWWMRGEDPADLSPVDLEISIERAIPWLTWVHELGDLTRKRVSSPGR